MSLFNWFSGKPKTKKPHFQPRSASTPNGKAQPGSQRQASRKNDQTERRDLLYIIVRDTMARAGISSSSYKFKVLSLDQQSGQFLVMVDLDPEHGNDTARLQTMEMRIVQAARSRFEIPVTAVYWRINNQTSSPAQRPTPLPPSVAPTRLAPRFEADELAAFKQALAKTTAARPVTARGNPLLSPDSDDFEDTIVPDYAPRPYASSLSATQYGDLH